MFRVLPSRGSFDVSRSLPTGIWPRVPDA